MNDTNSSPRAHVDLPFHFRPHHPSSLSRQLWGGVADSDPKVHQHANIPFSGSSSRFVHNLHGYTFEDTSRLDATIWDEKRSDRIPDGYCNEPGSMTRPWIPKIDRVLLDRPGSATYVEVSDNPFAQDSWVDGVVPSHSTLLGRANTPSLVSLVLTYTSGSDS
jgi:hypothetical protein